MREFGASLFANIKIVPMNGSPDHLTGKILASVSSLAHRISQSARAALAKDAPDPWKRKLDLACLFLGLPGLLLVMLLIGLSIKLVSPGPVFFKQERVGYRRKRFICFKFRTMKDGADTQLHQQYLQRLLRSDQPMTKMDSQGDPRLIPLGRLLRASGLDELPQLINVLRGEMSLVGPRPCTTYELADYLPSQLSRFEALPGLTGLWQVSGKNRTTFGEMVILDIRYAEQKSLWMDLKIMAATFPTLISQVGQARKWSGRSVLAQARH